MGIVASATMPLFLGARWFQLKGGHLGRQGVRIPPHAICGAAAMQTAALFACPLQRLEQVLDVKRAGLKLVEQRPTQLVGQPHQVGARQVIAMGQGHYAPRKLN